MCANFIRIYSGTLSNEAYGERVDILLLKGSGSSVLMSLARQTKMLYFLFHQTRVEVRIRKLTSRCLYQRAIIIICPNNVNFPLSLMKIEFIRKIITEIN